MLRQKLCLILKFSSILPGFQDSPSNPHFLIFVALKSPLPHWMRSGPVWPVKYGEHASMWRLRLGHKMHCSVYFSLLKCLFWGKPVAMTCRPSRGPTERPTKRGTEAPANRQHKLAGKLSEALWKWILQPQPCLQLPPAPAHIWLHLPSNNENSPT